jgi:hypothetical protein
MKDECCRECTESKIQILRVFERLLQGVRAVALSENSILQEKIRRDNTFEAFKVRRDRSYLAEVKLKREDIDSSRRSH